MKNEYEICLGNWGNIVCENLQEKEYTIAAKRFSDYRSNTLSWFGAWLYPEMENEYLEHENEAKENCEKLWSLIPNTQYLIKRH